MINIRQNQTIKFLSVVAVVFMPPTLIASVYGMNFDLMSKLSQPLGYPLALACMVVSGIAPWQAAEKGTIFFARLTCKRLGQYSLRR